MGKDARKSDVVKNSIKSSEASKEAYSETESGRKGLGQVRTLDRCLYKKKDEPHFCGSWGKKFMKKCSHPRTLLVYTENV